MNTTGIVRTRYYQPWPWKLLYPNVPFKGVAFSWGDTIYTPNKIPEDILIHESVHIAQQRRSKFFGFFCLVLYRFSKWYRRRCEVPAFLKQKQWLVQKGLPWQHLPAHLGGGLYQVMTVEEAWDVLR